MIHVHTLGASRIDAGRNRVKPTSVRKFAMLLHLSAEQGRPVPRAALQELIFPDQTERNAQHSLRELVYQLRQAGVRIESDGSALSLTDAVRCDYSELIARERPDDVQLKAVEGGFLPGYAPAHSEAFAEWFEGYRARAIFDLTKALLKEVHRARSVADWGSTERAARACLALDPLNEEATLTLAEVLAIGGSKAKAVKLLDDYLAEVGSGTSSADLRVPASVLKRRIAERVPDSYRPASTLTFVGREEEMLLARQCFEQARAGERQCLVIGGEPGIGKSRLAAELQNSILLGGAETRRVTMQPHDARRPLSVFMELVPQLLQMRGAIGCSPESLQLLKRLTERQEEPAAMEMRPEALQLISAAITRGIQELIEAIASEGSLAVFIDDAHWLDAASQRMLADLMSVRASARLLLVLSTRNHRPIVETFESAEQIRVLTLKRLGDSSVSDLVAELSASSSPAYSDDAAKAIVASAGGNPLFAILLARDASMGPSGVRPRSLPELLGRRLDVLDERSRSVLVACVAIGRWCTMARLIAVLEMPHIDLLGALLRLGEAGLVRSDNEILQAGHPLIAEVLRERYDSSVLRAAYHRAAEILEHEAAEHRSISLYWESAERWMDSGDHSRASAALRECARHALSLGRATEAVEMLQRACRLDVPRSELVSALRELIRAAHLASDSLTVRQAVNMLESRGAGPDHDDVEHAMLATYFNQVDFDGGMAARLRDCVAAHNSAPAHRVRAATWLLKLGHIDGDSADFDDVAGNLGPDTLRDVPELLALEFDLIYLTASAKAEAAIRVARRMEELTRANPETTLVQPQINLGLAYWLNGAQKDSIRVFKTAYERAEKLGLPAIQLKYAAFLALWFFDLGLDGDCDMWLARARSAATVDPSLCDNFNLLVQEIDIAIVRSDVVRALELIRRIEDRHIFAESDIRLRWLVAFQLWARHAEKRLSENDYSLALGILRARKPSMTGVVDFEASIACIIVAAIGRLPEAVAEFKAFLSWRALDLRPLSRNAQAIAERLGVDLSEIRWW